MSGIIEEIERQNLRKERFQFEVGDVVEVHYRIKEGDRERIQVFIGTVIAKKHGGIRETFTVRRIVAGEGVERIFPLHSPRIVDIRVRRRGRTRRAKLYFLRDRVGKATRLKERRRRLGKAEEEIEVPGEAPSEEAPAQQAQEKAETAQEEKKEEKEPETEK